jgi:oxygen-dependent protoporphyrinogen oxidase
LVAGGGIAGLSVAHAILRRGGDPLVLESSDRVGGYVQSFARDGIVFEHGPQGFLSERPGTLDLVDELGLADRVVRASETSKRRYVLHGGVLRALPMSPSSFLASPLLSWGAKLRVLGEPWAKPPPDHEETIREFVTRRLGREVADVLADAAVTGIYAGDPARLSSLLFIKCLRFSGSITGGLFFMLQREPITYGLSKAPSPKATSTSSPISGINCAPA